MYLLNLTTCMAESTEPFCQDLAKYLERKLGIPTNCFGGVPWRECERLFDQSAIQVLWLCGLPYVRKAQLNDFAIELLALPVPLGSRYRAPSPIPPWVASTQLPGPVRSALQRTFLGMHEDNEARAILARECITRFVAARDTDYDPIRRMSDGAASVSLV
jgi:ABC-type phosphate/phosphonate transport system substrate-binding protein